MGGSNGLTVGDRSLLQAIGNLSYGTWEGKSGGTGYVGAFTMGDGTLHLTKMLTHSGERSAVTKDGGFLAHVDTYNSRYSSVLNETGVLKNNLEGGAKKLLDQLRDMAKKVGLDDKLIDGLLATSMKDDKVVGKDDRTLLLSRKFLANAATSILNADKEGGGSAVFWAGIKNSRVKKIENTTYASVIEDLYERKQDENTFTSSAVWKKPGEGEPSKRPVLDVKIEPGDAKSSLEKLKELSKLKEAPENKDTVSDKTSDDDQIKLYEDVLSMVRGKENKVNADFQALSDAVMSLQKNKNSISVQETFISGYHDQLRRLERENAAQKDIDACKSCIVEAEQKKHDLEMETSALEGKVKELSTKFKESQNALKTTLEEVKNVAKFRELHKESVGKQLTDLTIFKKADWGEAFNEVLSHVEKMISTTADMNWGQPDLSNLNGVITVEGLSNILNSKSNDAFNGVPVGKSNSKDPKQLFDNQCFHKMVFAKTLSREFKVLQQEGKIDWPMTSLGKKRLLMMVVPRALMIAHAALRASTYFTYDQDMLENKKLDQEKNNASKDLENNANLSNFILDKFVETATTYVHSRFKMDPSSLPQGEVGTKMLCDRLFWNKGEFCLYDETNMDGVNYKFDDMPKIGGETEDLEHQLQPRKLHTEGTEPLVATKKEGGTYAAISNKFFNMESVVVRNICDDVGVALSCRGGNENNNKSVKNFYQFVYLSQGYLDIGSLENIA